VTVHPGRRTVPLMAELLDIDAAARRAGVSPKTIRRGVTSGRYAGAVRDSRTQKWLIPADSIDRQHDITHPEPVDVEQLVDDHPEHDAAGHLPVLAGTHPPGGTSATPIMLSVQRTAAILGITEY